MNILINCSNLKKGGGLQVADSVCGYLNKFPENSFVVVLSSALDNTAERIKSYPNVRIVRYDIINDWKLFLLGRDKILDDLVDKYNIYGVLTIFGPPRWSPKCNHVSGFARAQLVIPDSPYYLRMAKSTLVKERIKNKILGYFFTRGVNVVWTENPYISEKVGKLFPKVKVDTATNYYNQIFDQPDKWNPVQLPSFDGCTILSVNAPYPHKNMEIAIGTAKSLRRSHPDFKFRFVFTISASDYPALDEDIKDCFLFLGKVDISQVPPLYQQSDICFQPTLLECFTATYPEAMRMKVPIVTTDIEFAHGLCGQAAEYYSALDADACAESIYKVANNKQFWQSLIDNGTKQLQQFDNYEERASKLIHFVENIK